MRMKQNQSNDKKGSSDSLFMIDITLQVKRILRKD